MNDPGMSGLPRAGETHEGAPAGTADTPSYGPFGSVGQRVSS